MDHITYDAHAFGARYDLPIPLALFVVGGAAAVVLSFVLVLRRADPALVTAEVEEPVELPAAPVARTWPGLVSIVVAALLAAAGLAGSNEVAENILPTVFWLLVWIVVPLSCGIVGDWTRSVNPFAALARLVDSPGTRKAVLARSQPLRWPFGYWVASALFLALASGELIYNLTWTLPEFIAGMVVVYALVGVVASLLYGPAWLEKGEVFSVLLATWGRLGRWRLGAAGEPGFAGGLRGNGFDPSLGRVTFVLLLLVNVTFDGVLSTPTWARLERGDSLHQTYELRQPVLVGLVVVVGLVFAAFAWASARVGGRAASPKLALVGLLPSLLPIAFGYLVAHNAQYVLVNTQLMAPLIGNPLGLDSSNLHLPFPFNDDFEPHATFLPSAFYWYLGLLAIVLAHVVAVVLAHRQLARGARTEAVARRREYPWLVAMVAYTVASLILIAQPLVEETPAGSSTSGAATAQQVQQVPVHAG